MNNLPKVTILSVDIEMLNPNPYFSQVETAADMRSRVLGYIFICRIPCDNIDAAVSACLWRTFKLLFLLLTVKYSIRVKSL